MSGDDSEIGRLRRALELARPTVAYQLAEARAADGPVFVGLMQQTLRADLKVIDDALAATAPATRPAPATEACGAQADGSVLRCVLPKGHSGDHYAEGAIGGLAWRETPTAAAGDAPAPQPRQHRDSEDRDKINDALAGVSRDQPRQRRQQRQETFEAWWASYPSKGIVNERGAAHAAWDAATAANAGGDASDASDAAVDLATRPAGRGQERK